MRRPRAVALLASVVAGLALGEGIVRALSRTDADGQLRLLGKPLPPLRVRVRQVATALERYRVSADSFLAYDPALGWAPRPGAQLSSGLARANRAGIRSDVDHAAGPAPGVARIEVFGDSFTFGDELALPETWPSLLEGRLAERGVAAEVLNFGVNGYGVDQAYLRWREAGRRFQPAAVILGFQPENALRDLNVFRPLYFPETGIPLSKPRFVLRGDDLELVNSPALPPEQVVAVLGRVATHPLRAHERFLDGRYDDHWWLRSRLVALVAAALTDVKGARAGDPLATFSHDEEAREIARRLVARFAREVAADGAAFLVVYLPRRDELEARAEGRAPWDTAVLRTIEGSAPTIHPEAGFAPWSGADFQPAGHYGPRLNAIVADSLVEPVVEALCARDPPSSRPGACRR